MTINLETPVEAVFPYLDDLDDVMLMSIRPGWCGPVPEPRGLPSARGRAHRGRPRGLARRRRDRRRREGRERAGGRGRGRHRADRGLGDLPGARSRGRRRHARRHRPGEGGLMAETILVVDDDPDIARFVEVNLRSAGLRRGRRRRRRRGAREGRRPASRPRAARRDDAPDRRLRGRAAAAQEPADREHLDHHAHREGPVRRQGDRPAGGRRRLHHQAVRPDRAPRAREGHAASRQGDAEPLAADGTARQHPDPGGDRTTGARWAPVRGPVLRPRQLQDVQRPEGVRAR